MQTFLPSPLFSECAHVLDNRRLGKQRVECLQILNALTKPDYGWQNHPAVKMWRGYESALVMYGVAICEEWLRRGFKDTCLEKILAINVALPVVIPSWTMDKELHRSHQSNLIRKDPAHYKKFWPDVPADLPYVWPVK